MCVVAGPLEDRVQQRMQSKSRRRECNEDLEVVKLVRRVVCLIQGPYENTLLNRCGWIGTGTNTIIRPKGLAHMLSISPPYTSSPISTSNQPLLLLLL